MQIYQWGSFTNYCVNRERRTQIEKRNFLPCPADLTSETIQNSSNGRKPLTYPKILLRLPTARSRAVRMLISAQHPVFIRFRAVSHRGPSVVGWGCALAPVGWLRCFSALLRDKHGYHSTGTCCYARLQYISSFRIWRFFRAPFHGIEQSREKYKTKQTVDL